MELLRRSDIVSLHLPLRQATYHMIGERELGTMKKTAILINVSRGGLIDEQALYRSLKEKQIEVYRRMKNNLRFEHRESRDRIRTDWE